MVDIIKKSLKWFRSEKLIILANGATENLKTGS